MKLQFDANRTFQLDAVAAVADLFEGQPQDGGSDFTPIRFSDLGDLFTGQERTELGLGNRLLLAPQRLESNLREVQARNDIEVVAGATLEGWDLFDAPANTRRLCPHFSVEMETGTGKTYVYLRTVFQRALRLRRQADQPAAPVRDDEHAPDPGHQHRRLPRELHGHRGRAEEQRHLQGERPALGSAADRVRPGRAPDRDHRRAAERRLDRSRARGDQGAHPLCTLRSSATHRNPYNLVYRLDPVRAFELKLVKQIVVGRSRAEGGANDAFVRVEAIAPIRQRSA